MPISLALRSFAPALVILLGALLAPPPRIALSEELTIESLADRGWIGAAARDYLTAFIGDDPAAMEAYVTLYRDATSLSRTPAAARVARQKQVRGMLGAVELAAILKETPGELRLLLRSPALDAHFEFFFVESTEEAGKIGSQGLQPASAPAAETPPEDENLSWEGRVEAALSRYATPALAVAVARGGEAPQLTVRGVRTAGTNDAARADDAFHIGSVTKSMTASVIGRLVDRRKLRFDQTLGDLLPDLPMQEAYSPVTLGMVLRHRAGLEALLDPSEEREAGWRADSAPAERMAVAGEVLSADPVAEPGSAMMYSNAGYVVAAVVAETVTGTPWETLIAQEVFEPLGMSTAGLKWPASVSPSGAPRGHWHEDGAARTQQLAGYDVGPALAPAGDVHCSVADLARYGQAHLAALRGESEWLSQETAVELHRTGSGDPNSGYAMGWSVEPGEAGPLHLHAGSAGTFFAMLVLDPKRDLVVAAAANSGNFALDAFMRDLAERAAKN